MPVVFDPTFHTRNDYYYHHCTNHVRGKIFNTIFVWANSSSIDHVLVVLYILHELESKKQHSVEKTAVEVKIHDEIQPTCKYSAWPAYPPFSLHNAIYPSWLPWERGRASLRSLICNEKEGCFFSFYYGLQVWASLRQSPLKSVMCNENKLLSFRCTSQFSEVFTRGTTPFPKKVGEVARLDYYMQRKTKCLR